MPVDGVLLESEGRQFREELLGQARLDEEPEALGGVGDDEQLVELVTDALVGHDVKAAAQGATAAASSSGTGWPGRSRR